MEEGILKNFWMRHIVKELRATAVTGLLLDQRKRQI
jgi:hypothetical protein